MKPSPSRSLLRPALALVALGTLGAGCERTGRPERESATAGDAANPGVASAVLPAVTTPPLDGANGDARPPIASASSSAAAPPCPVRATCGSVVPGGTGLTFAASYCQGDLCRSARSKSECEARDVVKDCSELVGGADGRPDCRWDDAEASRGIACRPNK
jgi:hypothetical protein